VFGPEGMGPVSACRSLADVERRASDGATDHSHLPSCAGEDNDRH